MGLGQSLDQAVQAKPSQLVAHPPRGDVVGAFTEQDGELLAQVGLSQSALSQHLAVLRDEGLVATRREGTSIFYRIADPAALKVIAVLIDIYCPPGAQES